MDNEIQTFQFTDTRIKYFAAYKITNLDRQKKKVEEKEENFFSADVEFCFAKNEVNTALARLNSEKYKTFKNSIFFKNLKDIENFIREFHFEREFPTPKEGQIQFMYTPNDGYRVRTIVYMIEDKKKDENLGCRVRKNPTTHQKEEVPLKFSGNVKIGGAVFRKDSKKDVYDKKAHKKTALARLEKKPIMRHFVWTDRRDLEKLIVDTIFESGVCAKKNDNPEPIYTGDVEVQN